MLWGRGAAGEGCCGGGVLWERDIVGEGCSEKDVCALVQEDPERLLLGAQADSTHALVAVGVFVM